MKRYTIALSRHGRHWCEIVIEGREPDDTLADMIERFPAEEGFELSVWEEAETARIVEVGQTARVLGIRYDKTRVDLAMVTPTIES